MGTIFLVGASMSEPHTSELNGNFRVCVCVCVCVCLCVCLSVSYVLVLVLTRKMVPINC